MYQHGLPAALEVGLQNDPTAQGVDRIVQLTLEVPEQEVADPLVVQRSAQQEPGQVAVVTNLKLEGLGRQFEQRTCYVIAWHNSLEQAAGAAWTGSSIPV